MISSSLSFLASFYGFLRISPQKKAQKNTGDTFTGCKTG